MKRLQRWPIMILSYDLDKYVVQLTWQRVVLKRNRLPRVSSDRHTRAASVCIHVFTSLYILYFLLIINLQRIFDNVFDIC